ncbi:hypothetical protein CVV65_01295 [Kyrpidia spormannii]|uniref:Uncharacterized protein n=1 Tax=Kyrpidia spormannii TaxID=2055160 RepID=A0A2K8N2M4_9BACL|nr:hypothetical protein [Kyrpidia spormannii]ATY83783.1 hypothetical protein CVV65_01295 [Kyrpidia spormannii]
MREILAGVCAIQRDPGYFTINIVRNIPRTQVDEMKAELEQHLREAVRDGKTVTDVVGAL